MNAAQWQLLSGSAKSAISAACGVIISNFVDVPQAVFSWPWFRHVLISTLFVIVLCEARFWKQWADSGEANPKA
jgi:hypothetical protein